MAFLVMANTDCSLAGSEELAFGLRNLKRVLSATTGFSGWHTFDQRDGLDLARTLAVSVGGGDLMVVLNPALVVCSSFGFCMTSVLQQHPQRVVVAADPRSAHGEWQIDYASRAGLERYVARRTLLPDCAPAQPDVPWLFMVKGERLLQILEFEQVKSWQDVSDVVRGDALVAQHAFVHSFASYQTSDRADMLSLVPSHVARLMDVGGGEGWFLSAFLKRRQAEGVLVEPSAASADAAVSRGLTVAKLRFNDVSVASYGRFDCISFLDVVEHLEDPLAALQHAKSLLTPNGSVMLSIPNVGHWSVVEDLLNGRFDYLPLGILCCTHLRFFTELSLRELLEDAGFRVVFWRNQPSAMPQRLVQPLRVAQENSLALDLTSLETDSFHVVAQLT